MPAVRMGLFLLSAMMPLVAADLNEDLLAAVRKNDAETVKALLAKGAEVNAKSPYGATGLFFAADRGNVEITKILIEHGADVNVKDTFYGATALTWAAQKKHANIIRLLLDKGAKGGDDVLMMGASMGNLEMVTAVLDKGGASPATLSAALATATKNNKTEIVEALKEAGALPPPKADFKVDAETLISYAGSYTSEGFEVKVEVAGGKLMVTPIGQKPIAAEAMDKSTFRPVDMPAMTFTFQTDGDKVTGMSVKQGDKVQMVLKKVVAP